MTPKLSLLVGLATALSTLALEAQGVWPRGYATRSGGAMHATPFSQSRTIRPTRTRTVLAIAATSLPMSRGAKIRGLAFRRDGVDAARYPSFTARLRVRMRVVPSAEALSAAVSLHFTEVHEVFRGNVSVPRADRPSASAAAPFALRIPFAKPWDYPGGDLAIECNVEGPAGVTWRCDAVELGRGLAGFGASTSIGPGCLTSGGEMPTLSVESLDELYPGGNIVLVQERLRLPPQGAAGLFVLGAPSAGRSLAPGFGPNCQLFVWPPVWIGSGLFGDRAQHFARARVTLAPPRDASLAGVRIAVQGVHVDLGLQTPVRAALSNAVDVTLGKIPAPSSQSFFGRSMWLYGSPESGAAIGLRSGPINRVPVIEFL